MIMFFIILCLIPLTTPFTCFTPTCNPNKFITRTGQNFDCSLLNGLLGQIWTTGNDKQLPSIYSSIKKLNNYRIEIDEHYTLNTSCQRDRRQYIGDKDESSGYDARKNIQLVFNEDLVVIICNVEWANKIGCGTFVQVHYPFDDEPLIVQQIQKNEVINMPINSLCAGIYHLWFLYSTRIGKVVKSVKELRISYPSCQCD